MEIPIKYCDWERCYIWRESQGFPKEIPWEYGTLIGFSSQITTQMAIIMDDKKEIIIIPVSGNRHYKIYLLSKDDTELTP